MKLKIIQAYIQHLLACFYCNIFEAKAPYKDTNPHLQIQHYSHISLALAITDIEDFLHYIIFTFSPTPCELWWTLKASRCDCLVLAPLQQTTSASANNPDLVRCSWSVIAVMKDSSLLANILYYTNIFSDGRSSFMTKIDGQKCAFFLQ